MIRMEGAISKVGRKPVKLSLGSNFKKERGAKIAHPQREA